MGRNLTLSLLQVPCAAKLNFCVAYGAQKHDLLIDTAHDKPQAPEGPKYHIENKGKSFFEFFSIDKQWRISHRSKCGNHVRLLMLLR